MDIFTLCFAFPAAHRRIAPAGWRPVFHPAPTPDTDASDPSDGIQSYAQYLDAELQYVYPSDGDTEHDEFDVVHAKCLAISSATGCLVSAVKEPSVDERATEAGPSGWEFQLSGGYGQVMNARRMIMDEFKPSASPPFVKTSVKIPAIHVLQSIHSAAAAPTPLHPAQPDLSAAASPIKPDVRARLSAIAERTGANVDVKVIKRETARVASNGASSKDAFGFGAQPPPTGATPKLPWTTATTQPTSPTTLAVPSLAAPPISDSARSKSMYPFLPSHPMPQVSEHPDDIQRTDSPEMIASPESIAPPLPTADMPPPPASAASGDPWSATRSKTFDVARPRVAGIKSPLVSTSAAAPNPGVPSADDEDAVLEELKVWGFAEEKTCMIEIEGKEASVRAAKVLVLVLVDELNGLAQDTCEIDHRLQSILAGRKRQTINAIQEETNTNIYLAPTTTTVFLPYTTADRSDVGKTPHLSGGATHLSSPILGIETFNAFPLSPIPTPGRGTLDLPPTFIPSSIHPRGLTASPRPIHEDGLQDSIARLCISPAGDAEPTPQVDAVAERLLEMRNTVFVTGDAMGVMNAKEMLSRLMFAKKQSVLTKEAAVVPRKLDWIVAEKQQEITRIVSDNGSHVEMILGQQSGTVRVYGDHRIGVERTMKHVMMLFAELTLATVFTMPQHSIEAPGFDASLEFVLKLAASSTKAEVAYRTGQFQVCGTLAEVRKCLPMLLTSDAVKNTSHEIRFQCELAVDSSAFMAGKRNGKVAKITRTTGCQIKFDQFNNQNFLIDVNGAGLKVLEALDMLNDELPAEMSFHIPESYHRRIIGKGGASVQDVMRRHSAFVKFSSTEQWATFGGHHHNEDNVICITPNKNKQGLQDMKRDLMMSILTKDRDYDDWIINIDRKYHRALQAETRAYLRHIEVVHGANIRFLPREDGQDAIEVFASRYQAKVIRDLLSKVLPVELTCAFNINVELAKVAASAEWLEFTTNTLQDLQISILPYSQLTAGGESIFVLKCQRPNLVRLKEARARLDMFLRSQPKYAEPFDWTYGQMTSRSETIAAHGTHRRGLSTVVYGSEDLARDDDLPKPAGLRRADTTGGHYLDGWRSRKQMHKRSETEDGRIDLYQQQSGNYPPPIARPPAEMSEPQPEPEQARQGVGKRTQSLDIRNMDMFSGGGHSRHASFADFSGGHSRNASEHAYNQSGTDAASPSGPPAGSSTTFPRYKPGAYPRRGVSVYDPVQE